MRHIQYIVVHCTATRQELDISPVLRYWHQHLGWRNPGYHYLVSPEGRVHCLHPEEKVANGVRGFNAESLHVGYTGGHDFATGRPVDNRTEAQKLSLRNLVRVLKHRYPAAVVQGHRDFPGVRKACPCFHAKTEYSQL